jgi:5-methylcytosine-specific restriction endonuclease McrA
MDNEVAGSALDEQRKKNRGRMARWRARKPDRVKARREAEAPARRDKTRARWANDPEFRARQKANKRKWAEAHPERKKSAERARDAARKEQTRERSRRNYEKNKEAYLARMAAYHAAKADERNGKRRAREAAEPEKERARTANRAAWKKAAAGRISKEDIRSLCVSQFNACLYCKADLVDGYHIDHRMPLSLGGAHSLSNLQLLCVPCNQRKGNTHPDEYESRIGFIRG